MKNHTELFEALGQMINGIKDGSVSIDQGNAAARVGQVMVDLMKVEASIVNGSEGAIQPQLIDVQAQRVEPSPDRQARIARLQKA